MISLAEALAIHVEVVDATGGSQGLRDRAALEAALARPYATFDGHDLYVDPVSKAAALFESIVSNHPFVDGNKRTGYVLCRLLLQTHDLDLHASDDEEYDLVIALAKGIVGVEELTAWLRDRIVAA